ncbi:MAG: HEPN domain-containing protein [Salinibacter sp.]
MTDAQRELAHRAHERLAAARHLCDGGFFDDAASRAYYAMARMAEAALLEPDIAPKTHKGLRGQFGKQFATTGTFSTELGRNLRRAFDLRQMAEYSGTNLSTETTNDVIEQAASFVKTVESYLEESETNA